MEIIKVLYRKAEILILDEPTAVLTPQEVDELFEILRSLQRQGKTIIIITHKLQEVMAVSDAGDGDAAWEACGNGRHKRNVARRTRQYDGRTLGVAARRTRRGQSRQRSVPR